MKKKSIKKLELNKNSVSKLNSDRLEQIKGASWYYCGSEGMGCMLETRCGNGFCTASASANCPNATDDCNLIEPDPDHTRGCPSYNVAC